MALKKSELYSSIWKSCDELRGGMDASQYKDYVLVLLFVKYVSDKYADQKDADIEVPTKGGFADMVALKGDKDVGEGINKVIAKLAEANDLKGVIDVADFNDPEKLGKGGEMVARLSNLIGIFEGLDFGSNRADGDDLLGDAYEYLMRNFATESGKSKGQFYTPAEVSSVIAKVIGVSAAKSTTQTVYDPTCGSGSLLLKVHEQAPVDVSMYGQEMDNATAALAKMNTILHNCPTTEIWQDNTLSTPYYKDPRTGALKTFDFVVANPPFSTKAWSSGFDPANDIYSKIKTDTDAGDERDMLLDCLALIEKESEASKQVKIAQKTLDALVIAKYATLTQDEIKVLVVDDKWLAALGASVQSELDRVSQALASRIRQLAERYATPLPQLVNDIEALSDKVDVHLKKMGAVWS